MLSPYRDSPIEDWATRTGAKRIVVLSIGAMTLTSWVLNVLWMGEMDLGPGTPLHSFPVFVGSWLIMLSAMMLPSEVMYFSAFKTLLTNSPTLSPLPYARLSRLASFALGYAAAWTLYGTLAFVLDASVRRTAFTTFAWDQNGPLLAGSVLLAAGLYQVSTLKNVCLTHCRTPLSFFARFWHPSVLGSLRMGVQHGIYCVACCWALMAVMFAVGVMNLVWMALLTVLMVAEKVVPFGDRLGMPTAWLLSVLGLWLAIFPESFPFLPDASALEASSHSHEAHH